MSKHIVVLSRRWPFVKRVHDPRTLLHPSAEVLKPRHWVVLPDGRVGYVDHHKRDGYMGVRPVHQDTGEDLPNPAPHWTDEQRKAIPEEVAVRQEHTRDAAKHELPHVLR